MVILFKYATRARPDLFKRIIERYRKLLSNTYDYYFLISIDEDDITMNNPMMLSFLEQQKDIKYHIGNSTNKIEAINANMEGYAFDILFVVSDDMEPIVPGFDIIIVEKMLKHFPDMDGALHFNDGCFGKDRTITLTIMGKKLYDRFGYIYHPSYKSFFCDNEFTEVVYEMNKVVYIPQVIVKHKWTGGPNSSDALYRRNSKMGEKDKLIYTERKARCFPK